ncbi:MAG: phage holin family protein [Opitutales bacterium]|nr:phage holin family protein [Opitutales bacterium]MCH8540459.1 phage holin family protein [Opitutales bacterium]
MNFEANRAPARKFRWYPWLIEGASVMAGLWLAVFLFPGIRLSSGGALLAATLVLMALHFALRPILLLLAFPLIILTLGLGIVLVNALLFYLCAFLVNGFSVDTFGWALLGGMALSVVGIVAKLWFGVQIINPPHNQRGVRIRVNRRVSNNPQQRAKPKAKDDDIIDI